MEEGGTPEYPQGRNELVDGRIGGGRVLEMWMVGADNRESGVKDLGE